MALLDGKVALIVGGAGQMGSATSALFAREGAKVVVADINETAAKSVEDKVRAEGKQAISIGVDTTDPAKAKLLAETAIREFGTVDILVYTPFIATVAAAEDISPEDWRKVMDVNLNGAFYCCQAVIPTMKQKRSGRIILVSAGAAFGAPKMASYSTSKAGIIALTKCLAAELGPYGVNVNSIIPGSFGYTEDRFSKPILDFVKKRYPLGRIGKPEEMANAALFLSSHMADYVSAVALPVDGGFSGVLRAYSFGEEPSTSDSK